MQLQEVGQHWSWHRQWAQPTQHYNSPISTWPWPSPSTAPLCTATNRTTRQHCPDLLASKSHPTNCTVKVCTSVLLQASPPSCPFAPLTLILHPGLFSHNLLYLIPGQQQAPSEGSCPSGQTQNPPSSCQVVGRLPLLVWSDQNRPWWSWMMRQRSHKTWRYMAIAWQEHLA